MEDYKLMELFSIILIILNLLILFSFFIFHKRIKNSIKEKLEKYKFSKEQNIDKKYDRIMLAYSLFYISKKGVKKVINQCYDLLEDNHFQVIEKARKKC